MSFKRDGDDTALLHNLKMRRVGELLSEHIPDDEAKLLSNGRLTCLICSHRPIFDTCAVLANHRKGKKHIDELGKYLQHKRELEYKKLKNDHDDYLCKGNKRKDQNKKKAEGFSRKPILCLPMTDSCKAQVTPKSVPSATSQVRHYLKEVQRKRALQKTVERCREKYFLQNSPQEELLCSRSGELPIKRIKEQKNVTAINDVNMTRDLQLRMSGWIKSSDGKWMKDPEAEFDSDELSPEEEVQDSTIK